ncbi:hypothetical protein CBL_07106 [Carabus blaptoides fortunei]
MTVPARYWFTPVRKWWRNGTSARWDVSPMEKSKFLVVRCTRHASKAAVLHVAAAALLFISLRRKYHFQLASYKCFVSATLPSTLCRDMAGLLAAGVFFKDFQK